MRANPDDVGLNDFPGETALYLAARDGHENTVKALLKSAATAARNQDNLNLAEEVHGWTPLMVACVNGHPAVVRLLLEAGARQRLCDLAGWTEKEHAVFRGHMKVAELLAPYGTGDHKAYSSSEDLRTGIVRPGQPLQCALLGETSIASPLQALEIISNSYRMGKDNSQLFVTLGPCNTRSNLKPVELNQELFHHHTDIDQHLGVMIRLEGRRQFPAHYIEPPIRESMINRPLQFTIEDPINVTLVFELFHKTSAHDKNIQVVGTGVALLKSLRQGLAPNHESLIRDYTVPILANESMAFIGSVTFNSLLVTPFQPPDSPGRVSPGFWGYGSTQVVGHRGSGANSATHTNLQIGENTVQSFLSAISLGASCVEFDVQLTKDYVPVIFHDFIVMETGGDVPLHTLTFEQFMHLSRLQGPTSSLMSSAEVRYLEKNNLNRTHWSRLRSQSVNTYDSQRSQDLGERMKYTEEGLHNNLKGNLRGYSIQEPSSTLEQVLTQLPEIVAFDLEIKHPMLWEAEDRGMELSAIELNFFIDTILTMIFRLCGNRNITLSSFSPEVCILLACKQQTFPILFISKAGSVPTGDVRAGSLRGAIDFAKAWSLAGIVMLSDPFVMCPRLLRYAKDSGLVVGSYGNLNDEPRYALIQAEAGLDAIVTNKVRLISETLTKARV